MTFTQTVNPFTGILCVPYWYIWLLIVFSWFLTAVEVLFLYLVQRYRDTLYKQLADLENRANNEIHDYFEEELGDIVIDNQRLPDDVIELIMSMLEKNSPHWMKYVEDYVHSIYRKTWFISFFQFIYPLIRFIINFINFIIIILRYIDWYQNNIKNTSHWNKYFAFIITFLYLPNHKGRGIMKMFHNKLGIIIEERTSQVSVWSNTIIDAAFIIFFIIISFPVFVGGIFIYITTTLLFVVLGLILWAITWYLFQRRSYRLTECGKEWGYTISTTFLSMWFLVNIIMSTMEFYNGSNWINAYKVGFFGEYCDQNDYFQFGKWNDYPSDIQFLVISWILF